MKKHRIILYLIIPLLGFASFPHRVRAFAPIHTKQELYKTLSSLQKKPYDGKLFPPEVNALINVIKAFFDEKITQKENINDLARCECNIDNHSLLLITVSLMLAWKDLLPIVSCIVEKIREAEKQNLANFEYFINAQARDGSNVLLIAAYDHSSDQRLSDILQYLIGLGANPRVENIFKATPILALLCGFDNSLKNPTSEQVKEGIKLLLKAQDLPSQDSDVDAIITPFKKSAQAFNEAIIKNNTRSIKTLLQEKPYLTFWAMNNSEELKTNENMRKHLDHYYTNEDMQKHPDHDMNEKLFVSSHWTSPSYKGFLIATALATITWLGLKRWKKNQLNALKERLLTLEKEYRNALIDEHEYTKRRNTLLKGKTDEEITTLNAYVNEHLALSPAPA